jgi:hypothetical protein
VAGNYFHGHNKKNGEPFVFKRFWCKNSKENTKKGDEKAEREEVNLSKRRQS